MKNGNLSSVIDTIGIDDHRRGIDVKMSINNYHRLLEVFKHEKYYFPREFVARILVIWSQKEVRSQIWS